MTKTKIEASEPCPACESMELTTRFLLNGVVIKEQRSVIDDISLIRSTLATMEASGAEFNDAVLALMATAGDHKLHASQCPCGQCQSVSQGGKAK